MRALRMPVWTLALIFVSFSICHAKTNYAYVANYSANTVSVINTTNNIVIKTISVGTGPGNVAVNQAGTIVYVNNYLSGSVSVISTSSNRVVATIPVQSNPNGIAFTPNGKSAYVANGGSNSVSVTNTSTKKVVATVSVPGNPTGAAITGNGAWVYVACALSNEVSVISTLTNTVVATIPVGSSPNGVAISPDGSTVFVMNIGSNSVSVIRTADNSVVNTITVAAPGPWGGAVSPDGHWLYTAQTSSSNDGNFVTVIDTTTQAIAATIVVGTGPINVGFSQDSTFAYVTNHGSGSVSVIDTQTKAVVNTISGLTQPYGVAVMGTKKVSTVVGGYTGDNGPANSAALMPQSTVMDKAGDLYISDSPANRIRKVTPTGTITTYAGTGVCGYNGENIPAKSAMLCAPEGLALDSAGNLFVADGGNNRLRKISKSGKITTVAGSGLGGYSGDGGPAINATLNCPYGVALDSAGNLYFSEHYNNIIRKVSTTGTISTYAGNGTEGFSGDGGPATSATMRVPRGIGFDDSGNLYIADAANWRVRVVSPIGIINTYAGNGNSSCHGGDGGLATNAPIGPPEGIAIRGGTLYISGGACSRVHAVSLATNTINTFAGSGRGYDGDNNPPLSSRFLSPHFTNFDAAGNALIGDTFNGRVRKVTGGLVETFIGGYLGDGRNANSAALVFPQAMTIDKSGNFYIADMFGNRVRKVSGGTISTIVGISVDGYSGDGGPGTSALLSGPQGVAADSAGNVFIADTNNNVIRKVDTAGKISTFASDPNFGYFLSQMTTDAADNLYVADSGASVVWEITPAGMVYVFAGVLFSYGYNGDNIPASSALLNGPVRVAVDAQGNVVIADTYNSRVRKVNSSGIISTIAGDGNCNYTGDGGSATSAELCEPWSIAVNSSGTIYILDYAYGRIRQISGGIINAFAGTGYRFNGDGLWPLLTTFDDPVSVAVDSKDAVYVLDDYERRLRKIQ